MLQDGRYSVVLGGVDVVGTGRMSGGPCVFLVSSRCLFFGLWDGGHGRNKGKEELRVGGVNRMRCLSEVLAEDERWPPDNVSRQLAERAQRNGHSFGFLSRCKIL